MDTPMLVRRNSVAECLKSCSSRCNNPLTAGGVLSPQSVLNHLIFPACPVQLYYLNAAFCLLLTLFDAVVLPSFLPSTCSFCLWLGLQVWLYRDVSITVYSFSPLTFTFLTSRPSFHLLERLLRERF